MDKGPAFHKSKDLISIPGNLGLKGGADKLPSDLYKCTAAAPIPNKYINANLNKANGTGLQPDPPPRQLGLTLNRALCLVPGLLHTPLLSFGRSYSHPLHTQNPVIWVRCLVLPLPQARHNAENVRWNRFLQLLTDPAFSLQAACFQLCNSKLWDPLKEMP